MSDEEVRVVIFMFVVWLVIVAIPFITEAFERSHMAKNPEKDQGDGSPRGSGSNWISGGSGSAGSAGSGSGSGSCGTGGC